MGSSLSSLCSCTGETDDGSVRIMKANGKSIMVKEGTKVKDILRQHPHHVVLRSSKADRTMPVWVILPEAYELYRSQDKQYLLLSAEAAAIGDHGKPDNAGQVILLNSNFEVNKKSQWRPTLNTIPEVNSMEM